MQRKLVGYLQGSSLDRWLRRVRCCIRNRTSSELTEDRALLAGALLAKGGAVKLTRTMSNARISEQILTRLLCKRMGAALVGNTRLGTIDLGDNPQLQVRAARILSAACSTDFVSDVSRQRLSASILSVLWENVLTDPQTHRSF